MYSLQIFSFILPVAFNFIISFAVPLLAMQETWVPSLGWEDPLESAMQETSVPSLDRNDSLEKDMATHSSILAWEMQ